MYFEPSFFEAETRDGFRIKSMMKKVWAEQLEVLYQVDLICKRHNIPYFADSGTLLGAVRHKGYIPWDDDLDILMLRKDFSRFKHFSAKELPDEFTVYGRQAKNDKNQVVRICNCQTISTAPDFLDRHHNCPYIVGLDIFVCDNLPAKGSPEEEIMINLVTIAEGLGRSWDLDDLSTEEKETTLRSLEQCCGITIDRNNPIGDELLRLSDQLSAMYFDIETEDLAVIPSFIVNKERRLPRKWFSSSIDMPFENIMIPVPVGYHDLLSLCYGADYMTPKIQYNHHNYPYYQGQENALLTSYRKKGIPIPDFLLE